jgi:hypothetical protein
MVQIACFACGTWCDHGCYFVHAPDWACHNPQCRNNTGRRRFDRIFYQRDARWNWRFDKFIISFSCDGVTEHNVPVEWCGPEVRLTTVDEDRDGVVRVRIDRPHHRARMLSCQPKRRPRRHQPAPEDVPKGWTFDHHIHEI